MSDTTFSRSLKNIEEIIYQPDLHTRELLLLVCFAVVLIFIIVVVVALVQVRFRKNKQLQIFSKHLDKEQQSKAIKRRYLVIVALTILVFVSAGTAVVYESKPGFCKSCHAMERANAGLGVSIHKNISCGSCHQEPGILGSLSQRLEYAEMLAEYLGLFGKVSSSSVSNRACIRCHDAVSDKIITKGALRVEHKNLLKAGGNCLDCHNEPRLFHSEINRLVDSDMTRCMSCHDNKKASADCRTCHVQKTASKPKTVNDRFSKAEVAESATCRSCHEVKKCLGCHDIQLPHQEAWIGGGHAYNSIISKELCFECHEEEDCLTCHKVLNPHGKDWRKSHGVESKVSIDPCAECHNYERFCMLCHDE
jgi:hypothetical protein